MKRWLGVALLGALFALGCENTDTKEVKPDPAKATAAAETATAAATAAAAGDPGAPGCGEHKAKGGCPHAGGDKPCDCAKGGSCEGAAEGQPCPCEAKDCKGCDGCSEGCPHAKGETDKPCPCKEKGGECPHAGS